MINKISILYIPLLYIISETESNLLQPQYSIKVLNMEKTVFSLGEADNDDDLEIVKKPSEEAEIQKKLEDFHKYVKFSEITEKPKQKFYMTPFEMTNLRPLFEMSYPDSPHEIAVNEKHLSELERRSKDIRKKKKKKKKKRKRRKKIWQRGDSNKITEEKKKVEPSLISTADVEKIKMNSFLEKEYFNDIARDMKNDIAFKYSDEGKPEESFKDVLHKIVDVKTPKNCINYTGIGIQAVECILENFKDGELNRKQFLYSISLILLIWFCIYLLIAVPLWCIKGWCCCCCRCEFCFPRKTVEDIQKYMELNPPGVYINSEGEIIEYLPTPKETEIYDRLRRLIADF